MSTAEEDVFVNFSSGGGSYDWNIIESSQTDADSPVNEILMEGIRQNLLTLMEWTGKDYTNGAVPNHDHDGSNSSLINDGTLASIVGDYENVLVLYAMTEGSTPEYYTYDSGGNRHVNDADWKYFSDTSYKTVIRIKANKRGKYKCKFKVWNASNSGNVTWKFTVDGVTHKGPETISSFPSTVNFRSGEISVNSDIKLEMKITSGSFGVEYFKMYSAPKLEIRNGVNVTEETQEKGIPQSTYFT